MPGRSRASGCRRVRQRAFAPVPADGASVGARTPARAWIGDERLHQQTERLFGSERAVPCSTVDGERGVGCGWGTQRGVRRRGCKLGPAQRPVNPFAGERVEEPGRVADEQIPWAGGDRHPAAQRAGPQQRLDALCARQTTPQRRGIAPTRARTKPRPPCLAAAPPGRAGLARRSPGHPVAAPAPRRRRAARASRRSSPAHRGRQCARNVSPGRCGAATQPGLMSVGVPRHRGVQPVGADDQPRRDMCRAGATPRRRADAADPSCPSRSRS